MPADVIPAAANNTATANGTETGRILPVILPVTLERQTSFRYQNSTTADACQNIPNAYNKSVQVEPVISNEHQNTIAGCKTLPAILPAILTVKHSVVQERTQLEPAYTSRAGKQKLLQIWKHIFGGETARKIKTGDINLESMQVFTKEGKLDYSRSEFHFLAAALTFGNLSVTEAWRKLLNSNLRQRADVKLKRADYQQRTLDNVLSFIKSSETCTI